MNLLVDTHRLLWAAYDCKCLSPDAVRIMSDEAHDLWFSAISIAEVAIKSARGRPDFAVAPPVFRRQLLESGYQELALSGAHALALVGLPPIHGDPFDRLLVAQATAEAMPLLTGDRLMAKYGGVVRPV